MNVKVEEISVGIGLDDSELLYYQYDSNEDVLKVVIRAWNDDKVELIFNERLYLTDRACFELKKICRILEETPLLKEVLKFNYDNEEVPSDHPYKHYQFYNIDDEPVFEIICEKISSIRKL